METEQNTSNTVEPLEDNMINWLTGQGYWARYLHLNGFTLSPDAFGLAQLSNKLKIKISVLSAHINLYLANLPEYY